MLLAKSPQTEGRVTVTRYYVYTWDTYKEAFTPQQGLKSGPWSKWGLRRAIRCLRAMGYSCDYRGPRGNRCEQGDPSVLIEAVEGKS